MFTATCSSITFAGLDLTIYILHNLSQRPIHTSLQHCNENPIYVLPEKELRGLSLTWEWKEQRHVFSCNCSFKAVTFHSLDPGLTLLRGRMIQHANTPRLQLAKLDLQVSCDWSAFHETSHDWSSAVRWAKLPYSIKQVIICQVYLL